MDRATDPCARLEPNVRGILYRIDGEVSDIALPKTDDRVNSDVRRKTRRSRAAAAIKGIERIDDGAQLADVPVRSARARRWAGNLTGRNEQSM